MLQAKKEIYDVKQQRLCLAQDEYNHLNNALTTLGASRTSCEYILILAVFIFFFFFTKVSNLAWKIIIRLDIITLKIIIVMLSHY